MRILPIPVKGSLQNPAWSPDNLSLSFTRWRSGYNKGYADVGIFDLISGKASLVVEGGTNVSQPGSCWNAARNAIVLSATKFRDVDWPAILSVGTGRLASIEPRAGFMGYEPSWRPDGNALVFEQHVIDQKGNGRIVIWDNVSGFIDLTTDGDHRQPNWSWNGTEIVWQQNMGHDKWQLKVHNFISDVTIDTGVNGTDATFGPNNTILYSDDHGALRAWSGTSSRLVFHEPNVYAGAASWSWDGKQIAFETCHGDPDGGPGTSIAVIDAGLAPKSAG